MKKVYIFMLTFFTFASANAAEVVSKKYVDNIADTKLDISQATTQTMEGTYTLTGSLEVPTQPLPEATIE